MQVDETCDLRDKSVALRISPKQKRSLQSYLHNSIQSTDGRSNIASEKHARLLSPVVQRPHDSSGFSPALKPRQWRETNNNKVQSLRNGSRIAAHAQPRHVDANVGHNTRNAALRPLPVNITCPTNCRMLPVSHVPGDSSCLSPVPRRSQPVPKKSHISNTLSSPRLQFKPFSIPDGTTTPSKQLQKPQPLTWPTTQHYPQHVQRKKLSNNIQTQKTSFCPSNGAVVSSSLPSSTSRSLCVSQGKAKHGLYLTPSSTKVHDTSISGGSNHDDPLSRTLYPLPPTMRSMPQLRSPHPFPDEDSQSTPIRRTQSRPALRSEPGQLSVKLNDTDALRLYSNAAKPKNEAKKLPNWEIWILRVFFGIFIVGANVALAVAFFEANRHRYLLALLVFMKSKDLLSTVVDVFGLSCSAISRMIQSEKETTSMKILSLVCAYSETEDQIMKTIASLTAQKLGVHQQVICVILDGNPKDVLSRFTRVFCTMKRPYTTWKCSQNELTIDIGYMQTTPVILLQKKQNAGKKDSLVLGHDLFNFPRLDAPEHTKLLRKELFTRILPELTANEAFDSFDAVFCTDADSTIHENALRKLAGALSRDKAAIAACGVLLAELTADGGEWKAWHLYQQFQYSFGQYVRRQAEGIWGRVTCLPGCITMIAVRPEMAGAISEYARSVDGHNLMRHQVQYLGTDRRLTWCMTSQHRNLRTLFVPEALCETVVPASLSHYLSQRRRWASNAYFNDYFYVLGKEQRLITRLFGLIDIVRLSLVFYRVFNSVLFVRSLATNFYFLKIIPTLIVTKTPATWYLILIMFKEPILRRRAHKVFLGMCINQVISPILSVTVFASVIMNMGSQVWGKTGTSSKTTASSIPLPPSSASPLRPWTPNHLASLVRGAIKHATPKRGAKRSARSAVAQSKDHDKESVTPIPVTPRLTSALNVSTSVSTLKRRTGNRPKRIFWHTVNK